MTSDDTHSVHHSGRNRLERELRTADIAILSGRKRRNVAFEVSTAGGQARPVIVMAASNSSFSIRKSHEQIANAILAYVWHLDNAEQPVTYAMTYADALAIADAKGYTKTASWTTGKYYMTTQPDEELRRLLEPYRATPQGWQRLLA